MDQPARFDIPQRPNRRVESARDLHDRALRRQEEAFERRFGLAQGGTEMSQAERDRLIADGGRPTLESRDAEVRTAAERAAEGGLADSSQQDRPRAVDDGRSNRIPVRFHK